MVESRHNGRWQFSLAQLFLTFSIAGIVLALVVSFPEIALGIGSIIGIAVLLGLADSFAALGGSRKRQKLLTLGVCILWSQAASAFIFGFALIIRLSALPAYSNKTTASWPILAAMAMGALYCVVGTVRASQRWRRLRSSSKCE